MLKFNLRSRIDLIKPSDKVINYNNSNTSNHSSRELHVGDTVQIRHYQNKTIKWKFGTVIERDGLLHYLVDIDGQIHRRHIDQMRSTLVGGNTDCYSDIKLPIDTSNNDTAPIVIPVTNDNNGDLTNGGNGSSNVATSSEQIISTMPTTSTPKAIASPSIYLHVGDLQ